MVGNRGVNHQGGEAVKLFTKMVHTFIINEALSDVWELTSKGLSIVFNFCGI